MNYYNLIFSDRRAYRFERHFLFWLAVFLYHFVRISFFFPPNHFPEKCNAHFLGGINMGYTFQYDILLYNSVLPRSRVLRKKKYVLFAIGVLLLFIIVFMLAILQAIVNKQLFGCYRWESDLFDIS